MHTPTLLFGFILSTLYGALFHVVVGGNPLRLLLYIITACLGFWSGQFIAVNIHWSLFDVGALHLDIATLGSFCCLLLIFWLSGKGD